MVNSLLLSNSHGQLRCPSYGPALQSDYSEVPAGPRGDKLANSGGGNSGTFGN